MSAQFASKKKMERLPCSLVGTHNYVKLVAEELSDPDVPFAEAKSPNIRNSILNDILFQRHRIYAYVNTKKNQVTLVLSFH